MSDYDDALLERAAELADVDRRNPIRIQPNYHTTRVAAGTPAMGDTEIGFYDRLLEEDYHGLSDGQWVTAEHTRAATADRYQMRVTAVPDHVARDLLRSDELDAFLAGDALVVGSADHRGLTYNPLKVDDRIMRETVHRSSLIPPGDQLNLWSVADADDLPLLTYGDLGEEFAGMRDDDHPVQVT